MGGVEDGGEDFGPERMVGNVLGFFPGRTRRAIRITKHNGSSHVIPKDPSLPAARHTH